MWCRGLELVSENRVAVVVFPSQELISNDIIEQPFKSSLQYQMQQVSLIQELTEVIITFLIILNSKMNTNQFNICKKSNKPDDLGREVCDTIGSGYFRGTRGPNKDYSS